MTPAKRVLLVDGATPLRQSLSDQIRQTGGFETETADGGAEALARVSEAGFDAVILESALADMAGRELAARLRQDGERCLLVLLTPPGGEAESTAVSDLEVIAKPFRIGVLITLLRSRLRDGGARDEAHAVGPYLFRPAAKLLTDAAAGRTVRLTEKETAILGFLRRAGAAVTPREALLEAVWGYQAGIDTHTLETHIYRLRRKIEADPANARLLVTEPGGYRLAM